MRKRDSKSEASVLWVGLSLALCLILTSVLALRGISLARSFTTDDKFADGLTIPANLEIAEPQKESSYTLPADQSQPVLDLIDGSQPGIYKVVVRVNPGEAGMIYLKAFEVTQGTQLSARSLRKRSHQRAEWSDDPTQLFRGNAHITIYEGDWGQLYAARFELWFAPDSGQPERKLLGRVFKIQGWER